MTPNLAIEGSSPPPPECLLCIYNTPPTAPSTPGPPACSLFTTPPHGHAAVTVPFLRGERGGTERRSHQTGITQQPESGPRTSDLEMQGLNPPAPTLLVPAACTLPTHLTPGILKRGRAQFHILLPDYPPGTAAAGELAGRARARAPGATTHRRTVQSEGPGGCTRQPLPHPAAPGCSEGGSQVSEQAWGQG